MRSIMYSVTGGPDVLRLVDRPIPQAGPGEVRVRVVVSGVNPTDWKARNGAASGVRLSRPQVPNQDGAGYIDGVGPGTVGFAVGDRVWIWDAAWQRTEGTGQQFTVLPARHVVILPPQASFDLGASLGIPAITAHRALTSSEHIPNELAPESLQDTTVLIAGGAGAVGHAAIQLAVWAGAKVVTTVSNSHKAELAALAGAHCVINYRTQDVAAAVRRESPTGVDMIVEVNPTANLPLDMDLIKTNGTIAIYASATAAEAEVVAIPVRTSMSKNIRFQFILTYVTDVPAKDAAIRAVSRAVLDGALTVGVASGLPVHHFSLEAMAEAHFASEQNIVGKVLVDVSNPDLDATVSR